MIIQKTEKESVRNIAIYLRLSKDDGDREESESISNQRKIILDYIKTNFNLTILMCLSNIDLANQTFSISNITDLKISGNVNRKIEDIISFKKLFYIICKFLYEWYNIYNFI